MLNRYLDISVAEQTLSLIVDGATIRTFLVSTATNGVGEQRDSEKTPRGWHKVRAKIGASCPRNSVFVGRRSTGEIYSQNLAAQHPSRDWILTRILWLCGLEPGKNRHGQVDTQQRYIYIHGSPDEVAMGVPGSHGCIRMRNNDIVELFDTINIGTKVYIS